ncbi:hypothetical protein ACODT4_00290 [Streptomyces sp. 2.9]
MTRSSSWFHKCNMAAIAIADPAGQNNLVGGLAAGTRTRAGTTTTTR